MTPLAPLAASLLLAAAAGDGSAIACDASAGNGPDARAWCAALAARPRLPLPTPEERRVLDEIYARPELARARADAGGLRRLLAELWAAILERLGSTEAERWASLGRTVYIAAALAALVAALAALGRRRARARGRAAAEPIVAEPLPAPDRSAAAAEASLAAGDWAGAVRHGFLSALAALEEAGRLPRARDLTNGELARRLGEAAPRADFEALGLRLDAALYGDRRPGEPDAREALERSARLRAWAGGRA
jgi:hypothetical protein